MSKQSDMSIIRWAARRAEGRSVFVAADLAAYRTTHGISEEKLAEFLACPTESLFKLALCKRRNPAVSDFTSYIEQIAAYAGADVTRLAQLFREVEAIEAFRKAPQNLEMGVGTGFMAAARDVYVEKSSPSRIPEDSDEEYDEGPERTN